MKLYEQNLDIIKKEFHKFLKENQVYEKYYYNIKNTDWKDIPEDKIFLYINDAFIWEGTPEKHDFWSILDSAWKKTLKKDYKLSSKLIELI